jgi:hypothetical protein
MLGHVLDGVEIHERQECVECAIAWKYHTGHHLLQEIRMRPPLC